MKYDSMPLPFSAQADLLMDRGLVADRDMLIARLKSVNYFRFSGYLEPFIDSLGSKNLKPNTTLDKVWDRYIFDRQLRLLVLDAIERIEIYIGTALAYHHSEKYDPFGYTIPRNLPNLNEQEYLKFLQNILESKHYLRKEKFIQKYNVLHDDEHVFLPIWMATETISFGTILTLFRGVDDSIQKEI